MASSGVASRSRIPSIKVLSEVEIRKKRVQGEITCAECRRCRVKCDKKIPCGSCEKRGCASICPNGALSTGKGTRLVLSSTEDLHARLDQLSTRIHQLEDALAIAHRRYDPEGTHPLLSDELLSVRQGARAQPSEDTKMNLPETDLNRVMGTLTIDAGGNSKYYGTSGASESLLLEGEEMTYSPEDQFEPEFISAFPAPTGDTNEVLRTLESSLPDLQRALQLCEIYSELQFTWLFRPVSRDELKHEILIPIYTTKDMRTLGITPGYAPISSSDASYPHRLATLFLIFACACSMDPALPPYSPEADNYCQLGKTALGVRSIFSSPDIATIQALAFLTSYCLNSSNRQDSMEYSWSLIGLTMKLILRLGLHRESTRWGDHVQHVDRRRRLFWEVVVLDVIHALALGRPPCISMRHVDCEFPKDASYSADENGQLHFDFYNWKYTFSRDVYFDVLEQASSIHPPSYKEVLRLDQKIRDLMPPSFQSYLLAKDHRPAEHMQFYLACEYRHIAMLYVHRTYIVQALLDNPTNPLNTPYAPSVLAANRSSSLLIQSLSQQFQKCPDICSRVTYIWSHGFSAAMIAGSIVERSPSAVMAVGALADLNMAVDMFQQGAERGSLRAIKTLPFLLKLQVKANMALSKYMSENDTLDIRFTVGLDNQADTDKDLATFAGYTNVIVSRQPPSSGSPTSLRQSHSPQPSQTETEFWSNFQAASALDVIPDLHPSGLEYLATFSGNDFAQTSSQLHSAAGYYMQRPAYAQGQISRVPLPENEPDAILLHPVRSTPPMSVRNTHGAADVNMGKIDQEWKSLFQDERLFGFGHVG